MGDRGDQLTIHRSLWLDLAAGYKGTEIQDFVVGAWICHCPTIIRFEFHKYPRSLDEITS